MANPTRPLQLLGLSMLIAVLATSCAARKAYEYRTRQVEAFVYPLPADQVREGVREVLFEKGFSAEPDGPNRLRTDWRYNYRQTTTEGSYEPVEEATMMNKTKIHEDYWRYRYLIQLKPLDAARTKLTATYDEERSTEGSIIRWPFRDTDFEWEVLKRLLPDEAARIQAQAQAAAEKG